MQNGKCIDGSTFIPWFKGKSMAWDVTVPDQTLMQNHTLATLLQRQVQRRTRQRPTKSPNRMKLAYLLPSCHRNRRYLESLKCWACSGNLAWVRICAACVYRSGFREKRRNCFFLQHGFDPGPLALQLSGALTTKPLTVWFPGLCRCLTLWRPRTRPPRRWK